MRNIILLDGGMGQELVRRSGGEPSPLWSARVMIEQPDIVRDLHRDFILSGARVITVNSYSATPERLQRCGEGGRFESLQKAALAAARSAVECAEVDDVAVAGCLPPLVASYHPELAPEFDVALDTYRRIVALQTPGVDLFLCETMASIAEARAAGLAAIQSGKAVWMALTVSDDKPGVLRSGEPLADAVAELSSLALDALLLNCSRPESITTAWPTFETGSITRGAFANGFTSTAPLKPGGTVKDLAARKDLDPVRYAEHALRWVRDGAEIVGGCCEVGPAHIAELHSRLRLEGHEVCSAL